MTKNITHAIKYDSHMAQSIRLSHENHHKLSHERDCRVTKSYKESNIVSSKASAGVFVPHAAFINIIGTFFTSYRDGKT